MNDQFGYKTEHHIPSILRVHISTKGERANLFTHDKRSSGYRMALPDMASGASYQQYFETIIPIYDNIRLFFILFQIKVDSASIKGFIVKVASKYQRTAIVLQCSICFTYAFPQLWDAIFANLMARVRHGDLFVAS